MLNPVLDLLMLGVIKDGKLLDELSSPLMTIQSQNGLRCRDLISGSIVQGSRLRCYKLI